MNQTEINLNIVNLKSAKLSLEIMHLRAKKNDSNGKYTILIENLLNDLKSGLNCIQELEKQVRSNETMISSLTIALMKLDREIEELKKENKNLIELL